jgi:altronate dehydratase small subunit
MSSITSNDVNSRQLQPGQRVLVLAPNDNIGVAVVNLAAGDHATGQGWAVTLKTSVAVGHKLAIKPIAQGEKVFKFGAPIGSATVPIAPGESVHTHNLKSDYTPTYTHEKGKDFVESH